MITIYFFIVISVAFAIYKVHDRYAEFWEYIFASLIGLIVGFVVGGIVALALPAETELVETPYNLEALQDGNNTSGSFFIGSGNLDGKMMYVFYFEKDGFFEMKQVECSVVRIRYTDGQPIVKTVKMRHTKAIINLFARDIPVFTKYIIEIPKGSIIKSYTLDAK